MGGNVFQALTPHFSNFIGDETGVRRLAALAAERRWSQVGTVRFHHEIVRSNRRNRLADQSGVFERDDAGEGDQMTKRDDLRGLIGAVAETMKHAADFAGVGFQNIQRVIPGVALVNHNVKSEFGRQIELDVEGICLGVAIGAVHDRGLDILHHLGLQSRHGRKLGGFLARQMMIIEPGLTDGGHFGMTGQFTKGGQKVAGFILHIGRMDPDHGENIGIFFRQRHSAAAALNAGADGDDAGHPGLGSTGDHGIKIRGKIRIVEVGVGINEHGFGIGTTRSYHGYESSHPSIFTTAPRNSHT